MSKIRSVISRLEHSKLSAQLFRVVRIAAVGVLAAKATGSAVDAAAVTGIVEAAFRQVFPA